MQKRSRRAVFNTLNKRMALSARGLRVGAITTTTWHTISAELLDKQGDIFMLVELDPDSLDLLRYRRPAPHAAVRCH